MRAGHTVRGSNLKKGQHFPCEERDSDSGVRVWSLGLNCILDGGSHKVGDCIEEVKPFLCTLGD